MNVNMPTVLGVYKKADGQWSPLQLTWSMDFFNIDNECLPGPDNAGDLLPWEEILFYNQGWKEA